MKTHILDELLTDKDREYLSLMVIEYLSEHLEYSSEELADLYIDYSLKVEVQ